jgi:hypothetical protein
MDLKASQRMLITDGGGRSLGLSFQPATSSTPISVTASDLTGSALTSLEGDLTGGQSVLDGWTSANPTSYTGLSYLSLSAGRFYPGAGFELWSYSGGAWRTIAPNDLTFDGTYVSFAPTAALDGGGYAVSGIPVLGGDANLDGRVDINDLTIVLTSYGMTGMTWSQGDFTGDGVVDINDLTIVLTSYNATAGERIAAVPEPCTLALLPAGAACLLALAWRRPRSIATTWKGLLE